MEQRNNRTLNEALTETTDRLVEGIENLINRYESETGISVNDIKVDFDGKECQKKVRLLCEYYNFDSALVRKD